MNLFDRAKHLTQLWDMTLNPCPAPELKQFAYWADRYSDAIMQKTFVTTALRIKLDQEPVIVYKYVSGLARNLEQDQKTTPAVA